MARHWRKLHPMMPKLADRLWRHSFAVAPILAFAFVILGKRWI